VALVRIGPYDVVRVGKPPRTEFAVGATASISRRGNASASKVVLPVTAVFVGITIATNVAFAAAWDG